MRTSQFRKYLSVLLLSLLSVSMLMEFPMLMENEITEWTESSESKKDKKKDKKNLILLNENENPSSDLSSSLDLDIYNFSILQNIYPDIQTPPPEHI